MRTPDGLVYLAYIIYIGSISLAFSLVHSFTVLGYGEIFLLGVAALSGPIFLFKDSERLVIAVAHIFLAVLFHPEVTFKEPMLLDVSEQFELLRRINGAGYSWWVKADMAYGLSRSLKAGAALQYKISSPFWYWAFPPSLVLAIWSVVIFFYFPKLGKDTNAPT